MAGQGDRFATPVVRALEAAAGTRCCAPFCRDPTTGAGEGGKVVRIGEAAHISAASPGGPRYDDTLSTPERSAATNGIWMCKDHARLVDVDNRRYPTSLLKEWKRIGEAAPLASAHGDAASASLPDFARIADLASEEDVPLLVAEWSHDIGLAKAWGRRHAEATEALTAEILLNHIQHSGGSLSATLRAETSMVCIALEGNRFGPEELRVEGRQGGGATVLGLVENELPASLEVSHTYRGTENTWRVTLDGWPDDGCTWDAETRPTDKDLDSLAGCAFVRLRVGNVTLMMSFPVRLLADLASSGVSRVVVVDVDDSHFLAERLTDQAEGLGIRLEFLGIPISDGDT